YTSTSNGAGERSLLSGGRAVNTSRDTGAVQNIGAGAAAENTVLINGSVHRVGGPADGAELAADAVEAINHGGVAKNPSLYGRT
ncbi:hypothetical protein CDT92_21690, partial [Cronobacter sakazakii]|uniref:hypothetical protein n=1 Tax=Cronobacter sakazakii TaxID=28141 RepID=UPI000D5244E2